MPTPLSPLPDAASAANARMQMALRRFYLLDVLLHELGHHVGRLDDRHKDRKTAERFADWFALETARQRPDDGGWAKVT